MQLNVEYDFWPSLNWLLKLWEILDRVSKRSVHTDIFCLVDQRQCVCEDESNCGEKGVVRRHISVFVRNWRMKNDGVIILEFRCFLTREMELVKTLHGASTCRIYNELRK